MDSTQTSSSCPTTTRMGARPPLTPRPLTPSLVKKPIEVSIIDKFANNKLAYIKSIENEHDKSNSLWAKLRNIFRTKFTTKEVILISILSFGNFCFGTAFSIQSPFFPTEALTRGVEENWIGLIVGLGEFGYIPGSILAAKLLSRIKGKHILTIGLLSVGISNILFGTLQWCYLPTEFIAIAISLRVIMGIGMGMFFTSCYNTLFLEFPEHLSRLYATVEMSYAVGMITGPAIGGVINQFGNTFGAGFCLPFFLLGVLLLIAAIITSFSIHSQKKFQNTEKTNIFKLLTKYGIMLNVFINFNAGALIGFNTSTLDLHLSNISDLSPSVEGVVFLISGIAYALFNQIWGNLAEKMDNCYKISLFGCVSSLLCFTFVGPIPMIPIEPQLWLVIVAQVFLGIGVGASLVGSFVQGYRETIKCGFPESQSTASILSGLFASSEAIGTACGPIVGGYIMEYLDYRWSSFAMFVFQVLLICLIISFLLIRKLTQNHKQIERI